MKRKVFSLRTALHIISALILVLGLGSAVWIYRNAVNQSYGALGYEGRNGSAYPIMPEDSKKYLRDLELYGGRANVFMDELRRRFVGLWHGKSFAYTTGGLAIVISFGVFYLANHLPFRPESTDDHRKEKGQ